MTIRVGINGYGRIGRNVLRALFESGRTDEIKIVAVNDLGDARTNAHLTRHDSAHGPFPGTIEVTDGAMIVNGQSIRVLSERDPAKLPWGDLGVDVVHESTGLFANKTKASAHLEGGAKKVLISAPAGTDVDATVVYGVNHDVLRPSHTVVSNASCTTNCLAPLVKPLHEAIGVESGIMTTIHAYTNDQVLTDVYHSDLRRARSATQSMIPTKTGAAAAVGLVLPELNGKLDGYAVRVPTINVSLVDLTFVAGRDTSPDEIDGIMRDAAGGALEGILAYNDEPLVSIDFNHNPASSIFEASQTKVIDGRLVKVLSWYDNEWGFSNRMLDTTLAMMKADRVRGMADVRLAGRRVLIREDFNVPLRGGAVADDTRLRAGAPTIARALDAGAGVGVLSHLGRPEEGRPVPEQSLEPIVAPLARLLGREVRFAATWIDGVELPPGTVTLLENVRFLEGEKANDEVLARRMAALCDVYVNDAFATAHRAQASTHGIARFAPEAVAGPLLEAELEALGRALGEPARPIVAIVGGAKVSTKLTVLETLASKVDHLVVGGGIANTFLLAAGHDIGKSLAEPEMTAIAKRIMASGADVPVPVDVVCGREFDARTPATTKRVENVEPGDMIMDVGPASAARICEVVRSAATVVWNGPLGVFEFEGFAAGTRALAEAIASSDAFSVAGGGDTLAAIAAFGVTDGIGYISTGGGAFLEFLEGRTLPAVEILEQRNA